MPYLVIFVLFIFVFILYCILSVSTSYDKKVDDIEQEQALKKYVLKKQDRKKR